MSIHKKTQVIVECMLWEKVVIRIIKVYHFSEANATVIFKKGGVKVYKKFAELLAKSNKTAYQVSKETGIAQSTLSEWKLGKSKPKVDKLAILARYFGVSVEYFLEN
jgi:hypothetical protein